MVTITVKEIQRNLKDWLQRVKAGETLVIMEEDKPVAELKPIRSNGGGLRPYALCAGEFTVPDDFDDPLPDEIIKRFEG